MNNVSLRFSEFSGSGYTSSSLSSFLERYVNPVHLEDDREYVEIGIRSWGKGIFAKEPTNKLTIGNKRVFWLEKDLLILNIVFAWEQAIAVTSSSELGKIASHRFPMYKVDEEIANLVYIKYKFLTGRGKQLLELASPGGAGRNKTLGQKDFESLKLSLPPLDEQKKIAEFLTSVDSKLDLLNERYHLLKEYRKGVMQRIFNQEIRLKNVEGKSYSDWQYKPLSTLLVEKKLKNKELRFSKNDVLSVSGELGVVNQIEHLGRSYAGESVAPYSIVDTGDIVYTKSPLKDSPYGIIKANLGKSGIVSTLYAVYECTDKAYPKYLHYYFSLDDNLNRYLRPLVHKGAKNDMKINNQRVLIDSIYYPSYDEQVRICQFLDTIEDSLSSIKLQIEKVDEFRKGLLQKMFA
ncbi:restriction endonuclease subunit S [Vibrio mediterranei]|uniref:restriction endonuclease subunit S n=1 Tax=Vibrio mediterranei TaxID=689 RepID=UPI00148DF763|nr:restriction endonuclease subunit S [Vibrio mediterranei]